MTLLCCIQAASVKQELVKNVARLAERGRCLPSSTPGAPSASTDPDLAALHALVDDDLVLLCFACGCAVCGKVWGRVLVLAMKA